MRIKVYINKNRWDPRGRGSRKVVGRVLVSAALLERRVKSIVVKLDNGDVIERNIKRDVPDAIRQLKY